MSQIRKNKQKQVLQFVLHQTTDLPCKIQARLEVFTAG